MVICHGKIMQRFLFQHRGVKFAGTTVFFLVKVILAAYNSTLILRVVLCLYCWILGCRHPVDHTKWLINGEVIVLMISLSNGE